MASVGCPQDRDQAGDRPQPPAADHARRDRRRHAALRRGTRTRLDRRARTGARARAQLRRGHPRRRDRHGSPAIGGHDRRLHRRRTCQTAKRGWLERATSSPSISRSGFTSAGPACARPRAAGTACRRASISRRASCSTCSTPRASAPPSSSSAGSPSAIPSSSSRQPRRTRDRIARLRSRARVRSSAATGSAPTFARARRAMSQVAGGRVTMFRAPEWSINGAFALGARHSRRGGLPARRQHGAAQDRRRRRLSALSSRQKHRSRADNRGAAARRRSVRAGHADGMGMGTAHELSAPRSSDNRSGERCQPASGPDGASLGTRSEPAARTVAAAVALRSLLPTRRIPESSARHPARSSLWSSWRGRQDTARTVKICVRVLAACAVAGALGRAAGPRGGRATHAAARRDSTNRMARPCGCSMRPAGFRSLLPSVSRDRLPMRRWTRG